MDVDDISGKVIGCAIEVHRQLGPGLFESTYEACLKHELALNEIRFTAQESVPIHYKNVQLDCGYRLDLLVEDVIVVELKAVDKLLPIHEAQLLTYLRLTKKRIGLLLNFNVSLLKDGVRRFVL